MKINSCILHIGLVGSILLSGGCGSGGTSSSEVSSPPSESSPQQEDASWYRPASGVSWQWQLQGTLNTDYAVELYDVDLFDTPAETLSELQAKGIKVICYFSAGTYEDFRPDKADFLPSALGLTLEQWGNEQWLDVRSENVKQIMQSRLDLAQSKGCDGVEPDNVDGYANASGFPLTAEDQLSFNQFLSQEAHKKGLAIGLKNDLDQIPQLVDAFDFAVNEQCFEYDECDALSPFIDQNKAVLNAEYAERLVSDVSERNSVCQDSINRQFSTLILPLALDDSFRIACP